MNFLLPGAAISIRAGARPSNRYCIGGGSSFAALNPQKQKQLICFSHAKVLSHENGRTCALRWQTPLSEASLGVTHRTSALFGNLSRYTSSRMPLNEDACVQIWNDNQYFYEQSRTESEAVPSSLNILRIYADAISAYIPQYLYRCIQCNMLFFKA